MKPKQMGVAAGVVALLLGGWLWWAKGSTDKKVEYKWMHCPDPDCNLEMPYNAKKARMPCPSCGPKGPLMIPTTKPMAEGGEDEMSGSQKAVAFGVLALVLLQAGVYLWVLRNRARRRAAAEMREKPLKCLCPLCKRKLAYPAKKAGVEITCPRCKRGFVLPAHGLEEG